jgi:hypothetical protein
VVAERRSFAGAQDRPPENCLAGWFACVGGVNAVVEQLPPATLQLGVDDAGVEPGFGCLPAGYYAVLDFEQVLAGAGEMAGHDATMTVSRLDRGRSGPGCGRLRECAGAVDEQGIDVGSAW